MNYEELIGSAASAAMPKQLSAEQAKNDVEAKLALGVIEHAMGSPLTDEQKDLAIAFNRNVLAFANPGTGKTHTLTAGLLMAVHYWNIKPDRIYCMSYTNAATNELRARYERNADKLRYPRGIQFSTFHSLTRKILADCYGDMEIIASYPNEYIDEVRGLRGYVDKYAPEYPYDQRKLRMLVRTIDSLNDSFTFDRENIELQYSFKSLGMPYEQFAMIRKAWFYHLMTLRTITQGSIPLYCLHALINTNGEGAKKWLSSFDVMIVDEFQDLSLMDLEILNLVANKLVVVGDMKQQIYVFRGACSAITDMFLQKRPDTTIIKLSKSFRCPQPIADLATRVIEPNRPEPIPFTGRDGEYDSESCINLIPREELDWAKIFKDQSMKNLGDTLILYRNNASTLPAIEELYRKGIPFQCPKFAMVTDLPVLHTIHAFVMAAMAPYDKTKVNTALSMFPEFRGKHITCPPVDAMSASGKSIFEIHYQYSEQSSLDTLYCMKQAALAISNHKTAGNVIMKFNELYRKYYQSLDYVDDVDYYLNMVAPVCADLEYMEMVNREADKSIKHRQYLQASVGVRCYTMHASKGLEAKNVYMLDVNEGIFPNKKVLERKTNAGCMYDAAIDVRSERNLLYVAITRAKEKVVISTSNRCLSTMISSPEDNIYVPYDMHYHSNYKLYDDLATFKQDYMYKREA